MIFSCNRLFHVFLWSDWNSGTLCTMKYIMVIHPSLSAYIKVCVFLYFTLGYQRRLDCRKNWQLFYLNALLFQLNCSVFFKPWRLIRLGKEIWLVNSLLIFSLSFPHSARLVFLYEGLRREVCKEESTKGLFS